MTSAGVENLRIDFDGQTSVFTPGQTIIGRVRFVTSDSVQIKGVNLKFKGTARTSWCEHYERVRAAYSAEEEYFVEALQLVDCGEHKTQLLEDGKHVYPFSFSLPHHLPSTFNEHNGHVQYTAKVTIDIPRGINQKSKTIFNVVSPINLNFEPILVEPKIKEKLKYLGFFCCKSGSLTMVVSVPCTGFVPGQKIPLTLELDNNSQVAVHTVQITLERIVTFKAEKPERKTTSQSFVLNSLILQGIDAHASKTWTEQIAIPHNLVVTNLKYCKIIVETYILKVEAKPVGLHTNTEVNMKITLGNIPLTVVQDGI